MKKNVKILASLVRKAKKKLHQGKRDEALELMKKAVNVDDNNGVLVQVIKAIGRKKVDAEEQDITENAQQEPSEDTPLVTSEPEVFEMDPEPEPEPAPVEHYQERNELMPSEDQLNKYFEASDREFQNGHQQKALAYLKKAGKLYPDNPDIQEKMDILKIKLKSSNLVSIARKKLNSGDIASTVGLVREIFELRPETEGLDELLLDIEAHSNDFSSTSQDDFDDDIDYSYEEIAESGEAQDYINSIRQLVQENSLEKAASLASMAFGKYPDNGLLSEFVDNFRKLGLLD